MRAAASLKITGRVQGVWFRGSTQQQAALLGLSGWVRNMPDGSVEAYVEGEKEIIETFIQWCHRGPTMARVENVEVEWTKPGDDLDGFSMRY